MNLDDLELADDATSVLLEDFGVTDLDIDLEQGDDLVFNMQDIEDELTLDEASAEEDDALSAATLLESQADTVQTLMPYLVEANKALGIFSSDSTSSQQEELMFKIDRAEFKFVPTDVFAVLQSILVDAIKNPESRQVAGTTVLAEQAIGYLKEATGWSPGVYREDFIVSYTKWFERLRPYASLSTASSKPRLSNIVDEQKVRESKRLFRINTVAFVEVNNLFNDPAVRGSADVIELADSLVKATEYQQANRIRNFTVKDAYEFIAGYFANDEIAGMLKISQDERLSFSLGELVRRLALVEIQQGLVNQTGFRKVSASNIVGSSIQALAEMASEGSVVAEMFCLTTLAILASRKASTGQQFPVECLALLQGVSEFYLASLEHEALVNPVFFSRVTEEEQDSDYCLEFVVNGEVNSLTSPTPLCEVLGDGGSVYCIPYVLPYRKEGCTVCAPGSLFFALKEASSKSRNALPDGSCFRFMPTTGWMLEHGVLADSTKASEEKEEPVSGASQFNSLLQSLMEYDNQFYSDGCTVDVLKVQSRSAALYSVVEVEKVKKGEALPVHGSDDGYFIGGFITGDTEKGELIVQPESKQGPTTPETVEESESTVNYLAPKEVNQEAASGLARLSLFFAGHPAEELPNWTQTKQAARALCEMFALDYQDELERAQRTIAGDLYYIVGVHMLGDAIATKLMGDYLAKAEVGSSLDGFNLTTLKELADIVAGTPNELTASKAWDASLVDKVAGIIKGSGVTPQSAAARLDALNLKLLALQHIVGGDAHRDPALAEYLTFREVPGIRSRMEVLESYMVILSALSIQGEQALILFTGRAYYLNMLKHQMTKDTVDGLEQYLGEKARVKAGNRVGLLGLSSAVVKQPSKQDSSLLKYFVLERSLSSLVGSSKESYPDLSKALESACAGNDPDKLDKVQAASVFRKCRDGLTGVVYDGLAQEASTKGLGSLIAEFDMVCSFPEDILGVSAGELPTSMLDTDFYNYAGSFLISYCMIFGESAGDVDSGVTRDLAFAQTPDDFHLAEGDSLLFLRSPEYQIQDLHTWDAEG